MRHFIALAICLTFALFGLVPAKGFEVISVPEDVNAVNLSEVIEIVAGPDGRVQLSTAPDADGIMVCPETGWRYQEVEPGVLRCLDWPEDKELA